MFRGCPGVLWGPSKVTHDGAQIVGVAAIIAGFMPPGMPPIIAAGLAPIMEAAPPMPAPASIAGLSIGGIKLGNELGNVGGATIVGIGGAAGASLMSCTEIFLPGVRVAG